MNKTTINAANDRDDKSIMRRMLREIQKLEIRALASNNMAEAAFYDRKRMHELRQLVMLSDITGIGRRGRKKSVEFATKDMFQEYR